MRKKRLIFVHLIAAICVVAAFFAYRHYLIYGIMTQANQLDYGIPVTNLIKIIRDVNTSQPGYCIANVEKSWRQTKITIVSNTNKFERVLVGHEEDKGIWKQSYTCEAHIEGIPSSELLEILETIPLEADNVDKRVLSVEINDGEVKISTGATNHSLGGRGNSFRFKKIDNKWIRIGLGNWIS